MSTLLKWTANSPRMKQVLELCISTDMSNKEMAYKLGVTEGTFKLYVHFLCKLNNAPNRLSLMLREITRLKDCMEKLQQMNRVFEEVESTVVFLPPDFKTVRTVTVCFKLRDGRYLTAHDMKEYTPPEGWTMQFRAEWEAAFYIDLKRVCGMTPADVAAFIGRGYPLCIALDGSAAYCAEIMQADLAQAVRSIPVELARWTLVFYERALCRMPRADVGTKLGWESARLPGATHEVWLFIQ